MLANRNRPAFTLTELLVVIGIISLLVAILVPMVSRAREVGRRATCGTNLRTIGTGLHMYMQDPSSGSRMPIVNEPNSNTDTVGENRTSAAGVSKGSTRAWFYFPRNNLVPLGVFACPSNNDQRSLAKDNVQTIYDFETEDEKQPLSYGLQVTKVNSTIPNAGFGLTLLDPGNVIVAADQNGAVKWDLSGGASKSVVTRDTDQALDANSPNHRREGQNVLTLNQSVTWQTTPKCGVNNDNIWTSAADSANQVVNVLPNNHEDSCLMP